MKKVIAIAAASFLAVAGGSARADDTETASWPVKHDLVGPHGHKSRDISGIACSTPSGFPRSCLVIDDNIQDAQFVELDDGKLKAGDTVKLIDDEFDGKPLELDGEGVAFANGHFYVIGSHGYPRDKEHKLDSVADAAKIKARIDASSQIVRLRADGTHVEATRRFRDIIAAEPALVPFMDRRLEENGLTIEGIAVRNDGTLFAGFRGPVLDDGRAAVVSVNVDTLFGGSGTAHRMFRLPLAGRGVRDLAIFDGTILVLAGPMADGPGAYAIYSWDGQSESVQLLTELSFEPARKPEALLALDRNSAGLRVLILFDGDKEGAPTPVEIPAP
jgi:Protein of unknown function (DUF3616)/Esterase-like activity of phytase